jgi:ATP-dependent DNA helicase RecQ
MERARTAPLRAGACLLIDDLRFTGWTRAMLAGQLRRRGVPAVHPLVLATAYESSCDREAVAADA